MDITNAETMLADLTSLQVARDSYETLRGQREKNGLLKYESYLKGDHPLRFATTKFQNAFGHLFKAFADNYCKLVVNTLAAQLHLETVKLPDTQTSEQEQIDQWFREIRLDALSDGVHRDAFTFGNGYLICAEDPKLPGTWKLYRQDPLGMFVFYDPDNPEQLLFALKTWLTLKNSWRLVVYTQTESYRFESAPVGSGVTRTAAVMPASLTAYLPLPEPVLPYSQPGMPVFHFANSPDRAKAGESELKDIIPLQDALNKTIDDMMVGMEFNAWKQRWATGIEYEVDPATGKVKPPFETGEDRLWFSASGDVKFGEFSASDLKPFLEVAEGFRTEIARITRIPVHYLLMNADFPSGEALKTAYEPLLIRTQQTETVWGNVWEDVVAYWLQASQGGSTERPDLEADWEDRSPRSRKEETLSDYQEAQAETLKEQLGVSKETILTELGYDAQAEAQKKAQEPVNAGQQLLNAFDKGAVAP